MFSLCCGTSADGLLVSARPHWTTYPPDLTPGGTGASQKRVRTRKGRSLLQNGNSATKPCSWRDILQTISKLVIMYTLQAIVQRFAIQTSRFVDEGGILERIHLPTKRPMWVYKSNPFVRPKKEKTPIDTLPHLTSLKMPYQVRSPNLDCRAR